MTRTSGSGGSSASMRMHRLTSCLMRAASTSRSMRMTKAKPPANASHLAKPSTAAA